MLFKGLVFASCFALSLSEPASAFGSSFSPEQKQEIETIIHDYLMNNPQVLIEVAQTLDRQQKEAAKKQFDSVVESIIANKDLPRRGGGEKPKHYLIDFFDYNCGYCKKIRPLTERLAKEHPDLQVIYVEFPILSATSIQAATIAAALYVKDKEKYFAYHDKLMAETKKIDSLDYIKAAVKEVGADFDELSALAKEQNVGMVLGQNISLGKTLAITGVPYMILDGQEIRGAINSYEALESMLNK